MKQVKEYETEYKLLIDEIGTLLENARKNIASAVNTVLNFIILYLI